MSFWIGVLIFAVGILVSVCLHEAGHLLTAKRFGMKATQYFAGFGPTVFSFRRGETEYGLKAIPAGGFVKIVGMTPLEPVDPADSSRAFWRFPLWQRTVVLVAGSATHFLLALVIFYIAGVATGLPNPALQSYDPMAAKPVIGVGEPVHRPGLRRWPRTAACGRAGPATRCRRRRRPGCGTGTASSSWTTERIATYGELVRAIRATPPGPVDVTYVRDGERRTATPSTWSPPSDRRSRTPRGPGRCRRSPPSGSPSDLPAPDPALRRGQRHRRLGRPSSARASSRPSRRWRPSRRRSPSSSTPSAGRSGTPRHPISVVGASRIGGEAVELGAPIIFLALLGGLNVFIGVFNLFPLLPLDGGHVAIAWYERARSWLAARRGRPDPGRVDYNKLLPVTYVVILLFGGLTLLTLTADIVNPITLQ